MGISCGIGGAPEGQFPAPAPAAGPAARALGRRCVNIGNLISKGAFGCGDFQPLPPAPQHSIDGLASELVVPRFVLDVRTAPSAVKRWLDREHQLGPDDDALLLKMGQAFDILFYLDTVSAACPATH